MEIKSKDDLLQIISDMQGQMETMQETIDKMAPVEEEQQEEDAVEEKEESTEEDIDEIDAMLHEE